MLDIHLYINGQDYSNEITSAYAVNSDKEYVFEIVMNNVIIYKPLDTLDIKIVVNNETLYSKSENINTDGYTIGIT